MIKGACCHPDDLSLILELRWWRIQTISQETHNSRHPVLRVFSFLSIFLLYPWSLYQVFLLNPTSASFRKQNSYLPVTTSQFPQSPLSLFPGMKKIPNFYWYWVFPYLWTVSLCVPGWPWTFDPSASGSCRWLWLYHHTQWLQCEFLVLWLSLCILWASNDTCLCIVNTSRVQEVVWSFVF